MKQPFLILQDYAQASAKPPLSKGDSKLSQERVLKAIMSLGLSETDAQVYVFLALNGPHKARELTEKMSLHKEQLYRSLKSLQKSEIVEATVDRHPAFFCAVPFERVLDLLAKIRKEQERALREVREQLLFSWEKIAEKNSKHN